jgi:REP element-mobilizing transposase RayT
MVGTRYKRNAGAVFTLKYHLVWRPKYRKPILGGLVAKRLKELLQEKAAELGATTHALEIMPDHVHMFFESDPILIIKPQYLAAALTKSPICNGSLHVSTP